MRSLTGEFNSIKIREKELQGLSQKVIFQTDQKIAYIQCLFDAFKEKQEKDQNDSLRKVNDLEKVFQQKTDAIRQEMDNRFEKSSLSLDTKDKELEYLSTKFKLHHEEVVALGSMFKDQIKSYTQKQVDFQEEFVHARQDIEATKEQITVMSREMSQKLHDVEQNYFVALQARVVQTEQEATHQRTRTEQLSKEVAQQVERDSAQNEAITALEARETADQLAIQKLQKQAAELSKADTKTETELQSLATRTTAFRTAVEDQLISASSQAAEFQADTVKQTNNCLKQMSQLEEELTRRISFCNDAVVQAGLNEQYQFFRQQKYQGELEKLMQQGVLEVGQVRFTQAIVLRVQELENVVMQHLASEGPPAKK